MINTSPYNFVSHIFLRNRKTKLKCIYADRFVQTQEFPSLKGMRQLSLYWVKLPLVWYLGKDLSMLISNGINNPHYEDSVSVHHSCVLLATKEDVWAHNHQQSPAWFSSVTGLDLDLVGRLSVPRFPPVHCFCFAREPQLCSAQVLSSDADPSEPGSPTSPEEQARYFGGCAVSLKCWAARTQL